jgi:isoquinoline 1-oxidoreductase subunit beta
MPLRRLCSDPARREARRDAREGAMSTFSRRAFLKASVAPGAVLALHTLPGGRLLLGDALAAARPTADWEPNPWLVLHADGRIVAWVARSEMGQGVRTSLPLAIAEELDVDPEAIEIAHPQPTPAYNMRTSGSGSTFGGWMPLRRAGAAARAMLVAAAAKRWRVAAGECRTEQGTVIHDKSRRRAPYAELIDAARDVPVPDNPPLRDPGEWRTLGKPARRRDGRDIVRGAARYGLDMRVPGMLVAAVARPPRIGATLRRYDDARSLEVPGVIRAFGITNGVAVLARDTWSAMRGRDALEVFWRDGPGSDFDSRAHRARLIAATAERGRVAVADPATDAALAGAARRIEGIYEYPFQVHAPMEPMNCIAKVGEGECELWVGTQAANQAQEAVAKNLGIPPEKVRLHLALLGGGFGRRLGTEYIVEAVEVAKAAGAPVQVVWTREDDMRSGFFHPASAHRVTAGLDAAGRLVAWKHVLATPFLNYRGLPDLNDPDLAADYHWGGVGQPYAFPAMTAETVFVESPVRTGPWRAVHAPGGVLARECMLDEVARASRTDPVEFRLALLRPRAGESDEAAILRDRMASLIRLVAERARWGSPLPAGRGRGIAAHVYHGMTTVAQVAEASIENGRIRVHRVVCAADCGTVVNPLGLEGQIESAIVWGLNAALATEITFTNGAVDQTSFVDYPVMRIGDMPEIEIHAVPGGGHPSGIGEQPVAPIAAAVANAVLAATGKSVRSCPFRV